MFQIFPNLSSGLKKSKMKKLQLILVALCFSLISCGFSTKEDAERKSDDKEKTEETSNTEKTGIKLIDQINEIGKSVEEAAKNMEEGKVVKAVNFRELKKLLPETAAGIPRENAIGETNSMLGYTISRTEGKYRYEDRSQKAQMDIEITDAAATQIVLVGLAAWSMMDVDKEDDYGYERTMKYKGGKAYQKYDSKRKRGEFSTLVGERFYVSVKGRNVEMDDIIDVMDNLDFKSMEKLQPDEE